MEFGSPTTVLGLLALITVITAVIYGLLAGPHDGAKPSLLLNIARGDAGERIMVVITGFSLATSISALTLLASFGSDLGDQWPLIAAYLIGIGIGFWANRTWGFGFLLPYAAVTASVARMWHSAKGPLDTLQALIDRQDEIQRFLLLAAVSMVCCMAVLGARMELKPKENERVKSSRRTHPEDTIPRTGTLIWMRRFGLFWSLLLVAAYVPTQVQISRHADIILEKLGFDQVAPTGSIVPGKDTAKQVKDMFEARKGIEDSLKLNFSPLSGGSVIALLVPFISGILPGFGGKNESE